MKKTMDMILLMVGVSMAAGPSAAQLLSTASQAKVVSTGKFALNDGDPATVSISKYNGAVTWLADMDVDCDGLQTSVCNLTADPDFQAQTALAINPGANETYLDASKIPYIVVPGSSSSYNPASDTLILGNVAAVIYNNQVTYAIYGDVGPSNIIGEASYAVATSLGVNPNPSNGGVDAAQVSYILFTGSKATVSDPTNVTEIQTLGEQLATAWVGGGTTPILNEKYSQISIQGKQLHVEFLGSYRLAIFDAQGQQVLNQSALDDQNFDLSQLKVGAYFAQIHGDGDESLQKVFVISN